MRGQKYAAGGKSYDISTEQTEESEPPEAKAMALRAELTEESKPPEANTLALCDKLREESEPPEAKAGAHTRAPLHR